MRIRLTAIALLFILAHTACVGGADGRRDSVEEPTAPILEAIPGSDAPALSTLPPKTVESRLAPEDPLPIETAIGIPTNSPPEPIPATTMPEAPPEIENNGDPLPTLESGASEETGVTIEATAALLEDDAATPNYGFKIVEAYPHDRGSFVQGLVVEEDSDLLLEGSGSYGESSLRRVNLETGEVTQILLLPEEYFGEGITTFDDRIYQLTWKSGVGFVYDSSSFDLLEEFTYAHQGWGITHDGQQLIVSDGTDTIYFWDPATLEETGRIQVYDEIGPVFLLNELEYVDGEILANVWQTDHIVRIDPETGEVTGRIDLSGLLAEEDRIGTEGVLNGIAYDPDEERLFVTGKRWPKLFEIELVELVPTE